MNKYVTMDLNELKIDQDMREELIDRLTECLGYLEATSASDYFLRQVNKTLNRAKGYPTDDLDSGAV